MSRKTQSKKTNYRPLPKKEEKWNKFLKELQRDWKKKHYRKNNNKT